MALPAPAQRFTIDAAGQREWETQLRSVTALLEPQQPAVFAASGVVSALPVFGLTIEGLAPDNTPIALPLTSALAALIAAVPSAQRPDELGETAPRQIPASAVRIGNARVDEWLQRTVFEPACRALGLQSHVVPTGELVGVRVSLPSDACDEAFVDKRTPGHFARLVLHLPGAIKGGATVAEHLDESCVCVR